MISISRLSKLVYGGGAFNNKQYAGDNARLVKESILYAFENGVNAIDTSAYYGDSEVVIGEALKELTDKIPRKDLFIITKAGRWETNEFDYSDSALRKSVNRSMERLGTDYIDLLLLHDIEFQTPEKGIAALKTLEALKAEGKARYIGFSGYPVEKLAKLAELAKSELSQPVDAILSYCNFTLQNTKLRDVRQQINDAGVKVVLNASPLSMSLLRNGKVHDWHPAGLELREKAAQVSKFVLDNNADFTDLATQFSFAEWPEPTVIGMRTPDEVSKALSNMKAAANPEKWELRPLALEAHQKFGENLNETWESGIEW